MGVEAIDKYVAAVRKRLASEQATEHTYRSTLVDLLATYVDPKQQVINEPKHDEYGAPDIVLLKAGLPHGHVETKDLDADLNAVEKSMQLKRYRAGYPNLILTNYLEFRHYVNGEPHGEAVQLAKLQGGKIALVKEARPVLDTKLRDFAERLSPYVGRADKLALRMANIAQLIRDAIVRRLAAPAVQPLSGLHKLYHDFQRVLVRELTHEQFADLYAQTLCYGMFAARMPLDKADDFTSDSAAKSIPPSSLFLEFLVERLVRKPDPAIAWAVDDLVALMRRVETGEIRKGFKRDTEHRDIVLYFYEHFLRAYNPRERELRGVYYTPQPVVSYIVRGIDELLVEHFQLPEGLADAARVPPAAGQSGVPPHRVQILDPATGTGSFLTSVIDLIAGRKKHLGDTFSSYIAEDLLPRLHGFELLMAPYVIAHLKLAMQLKDEHGYGFNEGQRLSVYLADTLEEAHSVPELGSFGEEMENEARGAMAIKQHTPVLVVLGNPPYSGHSANPSYRDVTDDSGKTKRVPTFIGGLLRDYYFIDGQPLGERNPKWLQDDYVKFIRWAQWRIEQTGQGILGFITNHGYLDNPTFRGMRQQLLRAFDLLYVLDLHGNSKKKERVPEAVQGAQGIGAKDENVFDIQQGVAICLMVKLPGGAGGPPASVGATNKTRVATGVAACGPEETAGGDACRHAKYAKVFHADLWGPRAHKYAWLKQLAESPDAVKSTPWRELVPRGPAYLFVPEDGGLRVEFEAGWKVTACFVTASPGVVTGQDKKRLRFPRWTQESSLGSLR